MVNSTRGFLLSYKFYSSDLILEDPWYRVQITCLFTTSVDCGNSTLLGVTSEALSSKFFFFFSESPSSSPLETWQTRTLHNLVYPSWVMVYLTCIQCPITRTFHELKHMVPRTSGAQDPLGYISHPWFPSSSLWILLPNRVLEGDSEVSLLPTWGRIRS